MPDLHDIDTVRRTRGDLNELAANFLAGPAEFMPLDWSQDKTLDPSHSHAERQKLHSKGLAGAAGAKQIQISVLILFRIEQINNA